MKKLIFILIVGGLFAQPGETTRIELSEGGLHTKSDYFQNGKWVDGHEIYYKEAPNAKVLFK